MNRSRAISALSAAILSATLLVGCGNSDENEIRIAEPVLDFPQTSTTATPTPTFEEEEETTTEETTTEETTTTTSSSSSSSSSTRSSTTRSSSRSRSSGSNSGGSNREPAPAPAPQRESQPQAGAACAWPTQSAGTGSEEYSTFCDREWARTVTPADGQDFYWIAQGTGWKTIDPAGYTDNGPCWHRDDFSDAPEAIKSAVTYCPGT